MYVFLKRSIIMWMIMMIVSLPILPLTVPVYASASSSWTQTDWSGGSGQTNFSDATKFFSSSNINSSVSGQLTLASSSNWYNTSWLYRRKITFDNSAQAENLTDFPVLVKLNSSRINYSNTQNSGQDIRFTDSDGTTLLSYEIEKWDEAGDSFVWVKVPQIDTSSNTDHVYMYYGNATAADGQSASSVWSSNYKVIQHLKETSGTSTTDSTGNGNTGTKVSATNPNPGDGQVDGAQSFNGSSDYIRLANESSFDVNASIGFWFKTTSSSVQFPISKYPCGGAHGGWTVDINNTSANKLTAALRSSTGVTVKLRTTSSNVNDGNWHHAYLILDFSTPAINLYIDGVTNQGSLSGSGTVAFNNQSVLIGARCSTPANFFDGTIDEVRISNTTRSAAYIAASYKSESDTFNTFGSEEIAFTNQSGTLTSSIFDTSSSIVANMEALTYIASTSATTAVSVRVRSGNSSSLSDASDFSECNSLSSGASVTSSTCVSSEHRYLQYQVVLTNTDTISTPVFYDISFASSASPSSFELVEPIHNAYTNNDRATFSWKNANGANTYAVEIDNGDTNDFTVANIPVNQSLICSPEDYKTGKYRARYDYFSSTDSTKNTVAIYTVSSDEWGVSENDGKIKEGKRQWKVKARDSNGNERINTRTLFVDQTAPTLSLTKVNDHVYSSTISTTDTTPTFYGTVTDPLAGDKIQNKVASGPKKIDIQIEQKTNTGIYQKYRADTVSLSDLYFSSTNKKITDNSQQLSDKYTNFAYTPSVTLPYGTYKVTLIATDIAGNSTAPLSTFLTVTTLSQITTPLEKEIIKQETQSLPPEEQKEVMKELEITKPQNQIPTTYQPAPQSVSPSPKPGFFDYIFSFFK